MSNPVILTFLLLFSRFKLLFEFTGTYYLGEHIAIGNEGILTFLHLFSRFKSSFEF